MCIFIQIISKMKYNFLLVVQFPFKEWTVPQSQHQIPVSKTYANILI